MCKQSERVKWWTERERERARARERGNHKRELVIGEKSTESTRGKRGEPLRRNVGRKGEAREVGEENDM